MPPLNLYGLLRQKPACDALLDALSDGRSILALTCASKKFQPYIINSLAENQRLAHLFVRSLKDYLRELDQQNKFLYDFYKADTEFRKACSLRRFTSEILSFVPFIGEYAAEHFGYHIPGPGELWENFAEAHHLPKLHAEIDEAYANGIKTNHFTRFCRETGCATISSQQQEHMNLHGIYTDRFLTTHWQGVGIGVCKFLMAKACPLVGTLYTAIKVGDAVICYNTMQSLLIDGLSQNQRISALHFQRIVRLLSTDDRIKAIVLSEDSEYRQWLMNFSLTYISKIGIIPNYKL